MQTEQLSCGLILTIKSNNAVYLKKQKIAWI